MPGPLSGMLVMDVSIMAAGPWTGALLGMLRRGSHQGRATSRRRHAVGDANAARPGHQLHFDECEQEGHHARFQNPEDAKLARELAAHCDIFVQNFRVGVIERLGLDWPTLQRINPRLVYCAISGFGEQGPLARAGCADPIMQAFSGFACANGAPGDDVEAFRFTGFIDLATSSIAAEAVLAALYQREQTGLGQKVEVSMLEAALEIQFTRYAELLGAGLVPESCGQREPGVCAGRRLRRE